MTENSRNFTENSRDNSRDFTENSHDFTENSRNDTKITLRFSSNFFEILFFVVGSGDAASTLAIAKPLVGNISLAKK